MIAIIPARGGSKGLPNKNIKLLNGKPLIAYTIEAANKSKNIDGVYVSTDNKSIADIAIDYGAKVPFLRPEYLAMDNSLAVDTYIYTIDRLIKENSKSIENFIVLQPTSPLRTTNDIDSAIELFKMKNADSVVSYCKEHHPIIWHKQIDDEGRIKSVFEESIKNRQEEHISYYPNGAIYIFKYSFVKLKIYYSNDSYAYIMDRINSVDIDTWEDFEYAEFLMKKRN